MINYALIQERTTGRHVHSQPSRSSSGTNESVRAVSHRAMRKGDSRAACAYMSSRDVLLALAFVSHATRAQAQYAASKQGWNGDWNQSTVNSSAPCCREEWPLNACATQTSTKRPQVYSNDTLLIENDGTVKFTYLGFENVEQVDGFKDMNAVSGGIRSGNPTNGGSFSYTFAKAGVYYFRSQVHETLKATVNVMDCQYCTGTVLTL